MKLVWSRNFEADDFLWICFRQTFGRKNAWVLCVSYNLKDQKSDVYLWHTIVYFWKLSCFLVHCWGLVIFPSEQERDSNDLFFSIRVPDPIDDFRAAASFLNWAISPFRAWKTHLSFSRRISPSEDDNCLEAGNWVSLSKSEFSPKRWNWFASPL